VLIGPPTDRPGCCFINVPESKTLKNRIHFDVHPHERTRNEEVEWLVTVGASVVADSP
jgi:hypothetical protein